MNQSKLQAALDAAKAGFRVFPVRANSKIPAIRDWPDEATTDPTQIEKWWRDDEHNVGIATGKGLLVVDVDTKNGKPGLDTLAMLDDFGLAESLRVATPSGGVHVYLHTDVPFGNRAGTIPGMPGVDLRGDGGYVLAPGSSLDGKPYTSNGGTVASAEPWFVDMAQQRVKHADRLDEPLADLDQPHNVAKATAWLQQFAPEAVEGVGGDTTTYSVAAELRALGISEPKALELMLEHWNEQKASPPWLPDELAVKVANGFKHGQGAPGYKTPEGEFGIVDIDVGEPPRKTEILEPAEKADLPLVSAASFAGLPTPERLWLAKDLIPDRNVSTLGGDGATGKSLLAMQLAVACVSGRRWIGVPVKPGPVLYFSAEDDEDETHIRLKSICEGDGVDLASLDSLHLAFMAGHDALLAVENAQSAALKATTLFGQLRKAIERTRPVLVVLDNLADVFGGNENVKTFARQFIGMLRGLALDFNCAVLLLAHPSLTGMSSGSGSSGNVAWNNSVRSRLYLRRDKDEDGVEMDPNLRVLETKKANYAPTGVEIEMKWDAGRFVPVAAPVEFPDEEGVAPEDRAHRAERVFLEMVARFNQQGRPVSPSQGANYAPTLFSKHHRSGGIGARMFEMAMGVLLETGRIVVTEIGSPSRRQKNIEIARDIE